MPASQREGRNLSRALALCALLFGCAPSLVERRGSDLIPRNAAPGKPEVFLRADDAAAQLAVRLGMALAQGGAVVHLAPVPVPAGLPHAYVVALGAPANDEVDGLVGRVAIGPTELKLADGSTQPLLLIRPPGPPPVEPTPRPLWEMRFDGLAKGFALSADEQHALFESVVLWIRNRAADD